MKHKIKIGQCWSSPGRTRAFLINKFISHTISNGIVISKAYGIDSSDNLETSFATIDENGEAEVGGWFLIAKPKIIPGIPLDPTLPILMAGYLQDRARKRYHKVNQ